MPVSMSARVELTALPGLPVVEPGDDLASLLWDGLARADIELANGDVVIVTSKLLSRANDRFVDLATVTPSDEAHRLAGIVGVDPRLVELTLRESVAVSRVGAGALIVRHRLGMVSANACIDASNARPARAPAESGPWVLLLPERPDDAARELRRELERRSDATIGVIITDSLGRPFRNGTVGAAIGVAGVPALGDHRGQNDLGGRELLHTETALADQIAAAADMVAGQADEGRGAVHFRGIVWNRDSQRLWGKSSASELVRPPERDLYA